MWIALGVPYMHGAPLEDRLSRRAVPRGRHGVPALECGETSLGPPIVGNEVDQLAVEAKDRRKESLAEAVGALGDGLEHRLNIGRRGGDDPQDLTRRRLLLH